MTILCLDIGTKTGWSVGSRSSDVTFSGNEKWPTSKRKKNPQHIGYRYYEFKRLLTELKQRYEISEIYYEHSYFSAKGKLAGEVRNKFLGVLLAWACHHELPVTGVSTATLRASYKNRFSRDAGKKYAKECAGKILGLELVSDDEADAVMLLQYAKKLNNEPSI